MPNNPVLKNNFPPSAKNVLELIPSPQKPTMLQNSLKGWCNFLPNK